jgi:putative spermidine/putrescine transport system ATP-binding protein/spermidine/putrescine transport system ATP-binding protein
MGFDNILPCTVQAVAENGEATLNFNGTKLRGVCASGADFTQGDTALLAVRAERLTPVRRAPVAGDTNVIACAPVEHVYRGKYTDQTAQTPDSTRLKIRTWDQSATPGVFNAVACRVQDCVLLPN